MAQKNYAKKYIEKRDVVFVLDISGSMFRPWCENKKIMKKLDENLSKNYTSFNNRVLPEGCAKKIDHLKVEAMKQIHQILIANPNSRIAIVPFSKGVRYEKRCYSPLVVKSNKDPMQVFYYAYQHPSIVKELNASGLEIESYDAEPYNGDERMKNLIDIDATIANRKKLLSESVNLTNNSHFSFYSKDELSTMVSSSIFPPEIFYHLLNYGFHKYLKQKDGAVSLDLRSNSLLLPKLPYSICSSIHEENDALLLSNDIGKLEKKIKNLAAGDHTMILTGIIFASQLLNENNGAHKKIIFISDTEDNFIKLTNEVIEKGLCQDVNWQLSVIPISHTPHIKWKNCLLEPITRNATNGKVDIHIPAVERPSDLSPLLGDAIFGSGNFREKIGHNVVKK